MYYSNQSASSRRAGEELLRRMNQSEPRGCSCDAIRPRQEMSPMPGGCGCNDHAMDSDCSLTGNPYMPALAMVYSPRQDWTCLMDTPETALAHGTLFRELFKPFEGGGMRRSPKC